MFSSGQGGSCVYSSLPTSLLSGLICGEFLSILSCKHFSLPLIHGAKPCNLGPHRTMVLPLF